VGEGVDPTNMCRSLVNKVTRFQQLMAVADPELLVLFEDWLEELEEEVISYTKEAKSLNAGTLAERFGLPLAGATFLLTKLKREGRLV